MIVLIAVIVESPVVVTVSIELELPFVLRLPDAVYDCRLGPECFAIQLRRIGSPPVGAGSVTTSIVMTPATGEVRADPSQNAAIPGVTLLHTRATVTFPYSSHEKDEQVLAAEERETGRRFINAFLDLYRGFFLDLAVRPLQPAEFYEVRFGKAVRHRVEMWDGMGKRKARFGVTFGDYPLTVGVGELIPDEKIIRFRALAASRCELPLSTSLIMNARTLISQGDYRMAVVETGTALDVLIEDIAIRILVSQGSDRGDATRRLEPMSTTAIARAVIEPVWQILRTAEWAAFRDGFRQMRNSVVHDALQPSKDMASGFVNMVVGLRDKLQNAGLPN